jgi:hypothetical protein
VLPNLFFFWVKTRTEIKRKYDKRKEKSAEARQEYEHIPHTRALVCLHLLKVHVLGCAPVYWDQFSTSSIEKKANKDLHFIFFVLTIHPGHTRLTPRMENQTKGEKKKHPKRNVSMLVLVTC